MNDADGLRSLVDPVTGWLVPGVHSASLEAVRAYAVTNGHRERLWAGFELWLRECDSRVEPVWLWLGGSFVTAKPYPGDVDVLAWITVDAPSQGARLSDLMTILSAARLDEDGEIERRLGRVQPVAGLVDAFLARETPVKRAEWLVNWGSEWEKAPEGMVPVAEKGIVEVIV